MGADSAFEARMAAPGPPRAVASQPKWYHHTIVVALTLLFFFPIGALLLWTAPKTGLLTKLGGTFFFGIIFLFVLAARNADHTATADTTNASTGSGNASKLYQLTHPATPPAETTKVQVGTLLSEYRTNEVRADSAYKGQWITTTGIVGEVKKDIMDSVYVTVGTGAEFEIPEIQCFVADDQIHNAARLSKGNKVTVTGRVDGLMMNVLVKDCRF
jgi:hypothetical protein